MPSDLWIAPWLNDPIDGVWVPTHNNNLNDINVSFPQERLQKVKLQYLGLCQYSQESISKLTKDLGHLSSIIKVVLPTRLNYRFIQQQQIRSLKEKGSLQENISLSKNSWQIKSRAIRNFWLALQVEFINSSGACQEEEWNINK